MPKRGSVQLLLLFFRARARLGLKIGAAVALLVLAGALQTGAKLHLMADTGLRDALRERVWEEALAGWPEQPAWPWQDGSFEPASKVPRLGLSAAMSAFKPPSLPEPQAGQGAGAGKSAAALGDVAIGDRITVTAADGSSHVYRVTGRRVVDPHLADTDPGLTGGEVSAVTCWPLGPLVAGSLRLIIQATQVDPARPAPMSEQKL